MDKIIRKISIGTDYPHNCMHFERGQSIRKNGEVIFKITHIVQKSPAVFEIYVENNKGETMLWDTVVNMPIVCQHELYL